jgi:hypothetical protein
MKGSDNGSSQEEDIQSEVQEPAGIELEAHGSAAKHLSALWEGEAPARGLSWLRVVQGPYRLGA